jgi:hypothetical protein
LQISCATITPSGQRWKSHKIQEKEGMFFTHGWLKMLALTGLTCIVKKFIKKLLQLDTFRRCFSGVMLKKYLLEKLLKLAPFRCCAFKG